VRKLRREDTGTFCCETGGNGRDPATDLRVSRNVVGASRRGILALVGGVCEWVAVLPMGST